MAYSNIKGDKPKMLYNAPDTGSIQKFFFIFASKPIMLILVEIASLNIVDDSHERPSFYFSLIKKEKKEKKKHEKLSAII